MGRNAETNYDNAIKRDNLLSMLYNRLLLAKQLLSDDGVIFCSIDDRNQAYVKCLFDEVFGERNFVANLYIVDNLKGNNNTNGIVETGEYCLVYGKNRNQLEIGEKVIDNDDDLNNWQIDKKGYWKEGRNIKGTGENAPRQKRPSMFYPIYLSDDLEISLEKSDKFHIEVLPLTKNEEMCWNWSKDFLKANIDELIVKKTDNSYNFYKKQRPSLGDFPSKKLKTACYSPKYSTSVSSNMIKDIFNGKSPFNYTKSIYLIKDLLEISTDKNSIILDFFAGSGTTGHAVLELNRQDGGNRQFILVTNNEITDINPNGIAYDVTAKRLKRVMSGECYNGDKSFKWLEKNEPYGGSLEVIEIKELPTTDEKIFDSIDEELYGKPRFLDINDKIDWVCENFEKTCQKEIEND
ncbi:site-specific DNA-methyltransferase [Campylobacter sp. faydin G-24]|uniref:site-specific DNA-methyltransferase (adenine-specific) n=2 Tax=Campylobacter anatolicus TaxID=2829105 RepID=A0ABS5HID3_9BACT|nr:site-specific DNA-methyltransferase [Campylobacter anatolicus]